MEHLRANCLSSVRSIRSSMGTTGTSFVSPPWETCSLDVVEHNPGIRHHILFSIVAFVWWVLQLWWWFRYFDCRPRDNIRCKLYYHPCFLHIWSWMRLDSLHLSAIALRQLMRKLNSMKCFLLHLVRRPLVISLSSILSAAEYLKCNDYVKKIKALAYGALYYNLWLDLQVMKQLR